MRCGRRGGAARRQQRMAEVAEAIAAAQLEIILYGMVMPIVLGFAWL